MNCRSFYSRGCSQQRFQARALLKEAPPIRFTVLNLCAVVGGICLAFAAGRATGSPALAVLYLMIVTAWVVHRFAHGQIGATIISVGGAGILICVAISWAWIGLPDPWGVRRSVLTLGSLLMLLGISLFLSTSPNHPYSRHQKYLGVTSLLFFAAWWLIVPWVGTAAVANRQANDATANNAAMKEAGNRSRD